MKTIQPTFDWDKLDKPRGYRANTIIADEFDGCITCFRHPGNKDCPDCGRKAINSGDVAMYDSDVDRMLEKGVLEIDKTKTLSFAITTDNKFRITITEHTKENVVNMVGETKELFIDMPKEDLATLAKEFPKFVDKLSLEQSKAEAFEEFGVVCDY